MDYFATPKNPKSDDLEVTGISRSGRVRKKSSKLLDFESPDDVTEQRLKRQRAQQHLHAQQILEKYEQSQKLKQQNAYSPLQNNYIQQNNTPRQVNNFQQKNNTQQQVQIKQEVKEEETTQESSEDEEESSESEPEATNGIHHEGSSEESSSGDDDEEDDDDDEFEEDEVEPMEVTGFTKLEPPEQTELPSQAKNSLYMLEKYKKKLVIKDGKVISKTTKSQRKDKGVTRFTAYMLWSKEARQQLVEHHPNLDFATISKKLGELWATVPNLEKHNWKKRAKRLQMRSANPNNKLSQPSRQFINKTGAVTSRVTNSAPKTINLGAPTIGNKLFVSPPHLNKSGKDLNDVYLSAGGYKVTGTQPIDVAAHLALLDHDAKTSSINSNSVNRKPARPRRKNKEATRVTSFSLWAREQRKDLLEHNPHLDFPSVAIVLGELWAEVPTIEKLNWQKCAKRLRTSTGVQEDELSQSSKRKVTYRDRSSTKKRKILNVSPPSLRDLDETHTLACADDTQLAEEATYVQNLGIQPIDVAAHLALLGESLILIGKKLKENEGRISVSGSLPLLLDSLLCALGPLLCLTQQLPEMNGANPEVLSSTLDNIKYIMPAPVLMLQTLRKAST